MPNSFYFLWISGLQQYCQWEAFNATCGKDEIILMESAKYGRMRFGGCVKENHGHTGCSADVLSHLDRMCSGRRHCIMNIPDETLHKIHACPKELMSYLEAKYGCIKGMFIYQIWGLSTQDDAKLHGIEPDFCPCLSKDLTLRVNISSDQISSLK